MLIPDPIQQEREALAKAQLDQESHAEARRRATHAAEAEAVAPLAERTGALPERLTTLRYLSPDDQQLYARDVDGSFVLAYLRRTDEASVLAHAERIGKTLHVLGEDETPATRRAQQLKQQEMTAKVNAILERDAQAKADREREAFEAQQAKLREFQEQERARYLASRRPIEHVTLN
jgi:hypothetical protein